MVDNINYKLLWIDNITLCYDLWAGKNYQRKSTKNPLEISVSRQFWYGMTIEPIVPLVPCLMVLCFSLSSPYQRFSFLLISQQLFHIP